MRTFSLTKSFILFALAAISFSCNKNDLPDIDLSEAGHPRILLAKGEEQQIQDLIDSDETWERMHAVIIEESDKIIPLSILDRVVVGRRLLATSREFLRRIFFLSYSYRMTKDDKYRIRAQGEMLNIAGFSDWNPSHFLDVAEMTLGMAIGYDWLYDELNEWNRGIIIKAIYQKGIAPSESNYYNWFLKSTMNWNLVCNSGMAYGALAIEHANSESSLEIIERSFGSIPKGIERYGPDGAYDEGFVYWGYGATYAALFLTAVEKIYKSDRGLTELPGFMESANFMKHMVAPSGKNFSWGDSSPEPRFQPAMFWFADKQQDASLLWSERIHLQKDDFSELASNRLLPALMIWAKNSTLANISEPTDKFWVGRGANPVAMMRNSWSDPNAIYLGFKAGSPSVVHSHMDIGSFVMEVDGVRWASDFGQQNYESLESKGVGLWDNSQNGDRWKIFRYSTYSHNTIIIDDQQQLVKGYAGIEKHSDSEEFMYAISDLSNVYEGQLKKTVRGMGIKDGKYTIIRDEVETLDKSTKFRWNMLTYADVQLGTKEAVLSIEGKKLKLKVQGPDNLQMKTWSTAPTNDYDAENPGTIMVGFECELPANSSQTFEVILVPESIAADAAFTNLTLDEW